MKYVRIRSYYRNGSFTSCEHAYMGDSHVEAITRFRKDYPEHKDCVVVAETIDDMDPSWFEWFKIAKRCGCVHPSFYNF